MKITFEAQSVNIESLGRNKIEISAEIDSYEEGEKSADQIISDLLEWNMEYLAKRIASEITPNVIIQHFDIEPNDDDFTALNDWLNKHGYKVVEAE